MLDSNTPTAPESRSYGQEASEPSSNENSGLPQGVAVVTLLLFSFFFVSGFLVGLLF